MNISATKREIGIIIAGERAKLWARFLVPGSRSTRSYLSQAT